MHDEIGGSPSLEPANDHERTIAQTVDAKYLENPVGLEHLIIRDVATSLDFVMSASDSQFLVSCVQWRRTHPISPPDSN
jgi:hypothetical protein